MFFKTAIPSLFAPLQCEFCSEWIRQAPGLCSPCQNQLVFLSSAHCDCCAEPFLPSQSTEHRCGECLQNPPNFEKVHSVFEFEGPLVKLLHQLKFGKATYVAKILAELCENSFRSVLHSYQPDFVAPVPLSFWRNFNRGYNQSHLIAEELAKITKKSPRLHSIHRKHSRALATKSLQERQRSLIQAFKIPRSLYSKIAEKKILILDDVLTTGATCRAFSSALKKAGAKSIEVFTIARVRKNIL